MSDVPTRGSLAGDEEWLAEVLALSWRSPAMESELPPDVIDRILDPPVETRHVAFYTTQGRERLEASTAAQKLTRMILAKVWRPVGSGVMDDSEVKHVMGHLFEGHFDELDKLDKRVQKMPGLEGLTIFRGAFARLGLAA